MFRKLSLCSIIGLALVQGCTNTDIATTSDVTLTNDKHIPRNIIMVVADGMGPAYTTAYRNYADDPSTPAIETGILDEILVGNASTYPAAVSGYVTDSAAAATALATGVKSYNGAIGVDANKQPVESVLQRAKKLGMRTGVAVTSQINHATPASYLAHNESRKNYDAIADSFYDDKVNGHFVANVMLGGGTQYFVREDRNLVTAFTENGYQYVEAYDELASVPAGSDVIGLFAPVGLPAALDDENHHRLSYMTEHAIKHLENPEGFFLLVEASQVDWAGHANDIGSAMAEMDDMSVTVSYLHDYVAAHPDTLVVLTADHSTGGLTIGANGVYEWHPEYLRNMQSSVSSIAVNMVSEDSPAGYAEAQLGFTFEGDDTARVTDIAALPDFEARETALKAFLDEKTNTGWTTGGHTGVDVEVFAFGAGAHAFAGQLDNTDIAKTFFQYLEAK
ncbi:alkaline phosphatase [Alteromonas confluentis]|uniref:alkaline phosphatase n=1 Tax=Alteromonas confluentis TaxID=1656094 RepID=UPI0009F54020|nr:alkaline phosphatase [Alteromonas confluentis]